MDNKGQKLKKYLLLCLQSIILGCLIGAIVGLYQLGIQFISKQSSFMYETRTPLIVVLMVFIVIILAFGNDMIIRLAPGVDGSGIPNMELGIRHKKKIDWKKESVLMIVNSYISTFIGFPLGSEGPSVVIGGKLAKMSNDITNFDNDDTIAMACGTGFGCAFLSPLAGLCYIFEESLHKFNFQLIFRALLMIISAVFTTSLINHHHLLSVAQAVYPMFKDYYIFAILIIFNVALGISFVKLIIFLKRIFSKYKDKLLVKYRGFILFAVVFILNYILLEYMGSGSKLISGIVSKDSILLVLGILALRFVVTTFSGSGKATGGLVVPMMALGALTGQIACLVCNKLFGFDIQYFDVIILVSMCMLFGIITKTPITSIVLIFSAIGASTGDYLHALIIIPISAVSIFLAVYISKWLRVDCLYEQMMEVTLESEKKLINERIEQK